MEAGTDGERSPLLIAERVRRPGTYSMDTRHHHSRYELYWLVSGERLYFVRDQVHLVRQGDIVLVGAEELHRTAPSGKGAHERVLIEFERRILPNCFPWTGSGAEHDSGPDPVPDSGPDSVLDSEPARGAGPGAGAGAGTVGRMALKSDSGTEDPDILKTIFDAAHPVLHPRGAAERRTGDLFAAILAERYSGEKDSEVMLGLLLAQLLVELRRCAAASVPSTEGLDVSAPDAMRIKINSVCGYLKNHFDRDLDLESVARRFGMSAPHLSRSFHKITGMRYHAYLTSVRVRHARDLIRAGRGSFVHVAESAGFPSSEALCRAFESRFGLTPREYRKICAQKSRPLPDPDPDPEPPSGRLG